MPPCVKEAVKGAILALKPEEAQLVEEIRGYLDVKTPEDSRLVLERFDCLDALGRAISAFPSVRESRHLKGEKRDERKLMKALCSFASPSHLLHIPARVVAVRSYLVAKYQAFSFLSILVQGQEEFTRALRQALLSVICNLMVEEVYFTSLLDQDFSEEVKLNLANDLVTLWDSGIDPRQVRHLPALESLWNARDSAPPCFGTMDGTSELMRITLDMGQDWQVFIAGQVAHNETRWALEEFLFGLSYEEICSVRKRLSSFGIGAVNHDEISKYLDHRPTYGIIETSDPRSIFDFYVDRRDTAAFRRRLGAPGPKRTLEEIYLKHRIAAEVLSPESR
jgi:hypothetical protein